MAKKSSINEQGLDLNARLRNPDTLNSLLNTNFKFTLTRIPNVTFWCTSVNIPGINIGEVAVQNMFLPVHVPGSSIQLDQLRITFGVDENFSNWHEIYRWMRGLVPFEDFREVIRDSDNYYSDGTIHSLNSAKNPNILFTFKKLMPVSLDGFELNVTETDTNPVTSSVTFVYETMEIKSVS
jgi:hypothetical protein